MFTYQQLLKKFFSSSIQSAILKFIRRSGMHHFTSIIYFHLLNSLIYAQISIKVQHAYMTQIQSLNYSYPYMTQKGSKIRFQVSVSITLLYDSKIKKSQHILRLKIFD